MEVVAPDEVPALKLCQGKLLCGHQVEELPPGQQLHHHHHLPGALEIVDHIWYGFSQVERGEVKLTE